MTNNDTQTNTATEPKRKRKRRWGDAPPPTTTTTTTTTTTQPNPSTKSITTTHMTHTSNARAKAALLTQSVSARLAALRAAKQKQKQRPSSSSSTVPPTIAPPPPPPTTTTQPKKKAKVYDIDLSVTKPTFREEAHHKKPTKKQPTNPYLDHLQPVPSSDPSPPPTSSSTPPTSTPTTTTSTTMEEPPLLDTRLAGGTVTKPRRRHRPLTFVEPGTYIAIAEKRRAKADVLAKSGFASGRKVGTYAKSTGMARIDLDLEEEEGGEYYGGGGGGGGGGAGSGSHGAEERVLAPRADALEEAADGGTKGSGGVVVIPLPLVMEWWDVELLPNKLRKEVVAREGRAVVGLAKKKVASVTGGLSNTTTTVGIGTTAITQTQTQTESSSSDHSHPNTNPIPNDEEDTTTHPQTKPTTAELTEANATSLLLQKCFITASLTNLRTHTLIQHPVPTLPPHASLVPPTPTPTLHLTKREMKRRRKLRRQARQEELQANQMAGLIPPPPPRLTIANYVRVLGSQAVLDPSKMEQKVREQMEERKNKHERMNEERKLTKEQLREKRERKMKENVTTGVEVALFVVKDTSHRYHRTKIDLNAQQRGITGGVLECEERGISLVICEGGPKAVKAYTRLMLVRMKWRGENFLDGEDSEDEVMEDVAGKDGGGSGADGGEGGEKVEVQKFNSKNTCELVWTGMAPKRMFNSFVFQSCATSEMARKVLEAKGVAHFWDQVLVHADGSGEKFVFKLGD